MMGQSFRGIPDEFGMIRTLARSGQVERQRASDRLSGLGGLGSMSASITRMIPLARALAQTLRA